MARIAIQFFGHLRTFDKCFNSLKKYLLNYYDCDIFMHTWDVYNHNTKTWHSHIKGVNKKVNKAELLKKLGITESQIVVEHQKIFNKGIIFARDFTFNLQGLASVYHSLKSVNNLRIKYEKIHKKQYDIVICIRPDILLQKRLDLDKYINDKLNKGKNIYFAGHVPEHDIYDFDFIETIDVLFFGKPDAVTKLCDNLSFKLKNGDKLDYHPEGLLVDNMYKCGLKPVYLAGYQVGKALKIKRPLTIKRSFSSIIALHTHKGSLDISLFRFLPVIFSTNINLLNKFVLSFSLGRDG